MTDMNPQDPGRRRMLRGLAAGGVAVGAGVVGAGAAVAATGGGWKRETLIFDVACLGQFWRWSELANAADPADFRSPFMVEGWIYPEGTIPGSGFVPTMDDAIGHWFCRGWTMIDGSRGEPHANSIHEYIFGEITEESLFPTDSIASTGLEGTLTSQVGTRPIIGGSGKYLGASGAVRQFQNGFNTTVFADGSGDNAFNFRFEMDLLLPDV